MQMSSAAIGSANSMEISDKDEAPITTKNIPVAASTSGYWLEIGARQYRHLPRRNSHDRTGIKSNHCNCLLQCGHELLPPTLLSPKRRITTLRKLPTMRPK